MRTWKAVVCLLAVTGATPAIAEDAGAEATQLPTPTPTPTSTPTPTPTPTPTSTQAQASTAPAPLAPRGPGPAARPSGAPEETVVLDEISVTVTRDARPTRDVPQAIAVIGKERLEGVTLFNVKDAIVGTPGVLVDSKNGGYDARLLIRGAGLKAAYGIREIMLLRDGVPLTDPDSFTRLDWIDTQDVERIEVSKGPGNLYSPGSAGGAIQIISRSVFDPGANQATASYGTWGSGSLHLRSSAREDRLGAFAFTASIRNQENDWRTWNHYDSKQVSLKHGLVLDDDTLLESEAAYTESNVQLPGAMDQALYDTFLKTGRQDRTSEAWRHSGRYSHIVFANTRLERRVGDLTWKPRVYYNTWTHRHPVSGAINDTRSWTQVAGADLEAQHRHGPGTLVGGVTLKTQWNPDTRKYQYRDVQTAGTRITATLSDAEGALMERGRHDNYLAGLFLQESLTLGRFLVDVGGRIDRSVFDVRVDEITRYDYTTGGYATGGGVIRLKKAMWLPAPKLGVTFKATEEVSVYASASQGYQVPSESELSSNPALDPARSTSYEVGVKARTALLTLDADVFVNPVRDEIVSVVSNGASVYQNAGSTRKKGAEIGGGVRLLPGLEVGGAYAYSDFTYGSFVERVGPRQVDRSGNRLPYVPRHQWSMYAAYRHPAGLRVRAQTSTWGRYWMDSANSESYAGYAWVTSATAGWQLGRHVVGVEALNLLDRRFAMQATKDTSGRVTYAAGAPRSILFSYELKL